MLQILNKYLSDRNIVVLALATLFIEFPLEHILLYQENYWGFGSSFRMIFRLALEIPIGVLLAYSFLRDLLNRKSTVGLRIITLLVLLISINILIASLPTSFSIASTKSSNFTGELFPIL